MKTLEFTQSAGDDRLVHLAIPVDSAGQPYHLVVHVQPVDQEEQPQYLSEEFIKETAGQWVGEFTIPFEGDYEERESL